MTELQLHAPRMPRERASPEPPLGPEGEVIVPPERRVAAAEGVTLEDGTAAVEVRLDCGHHGHGPASLEIRPGSAVSCGLCAQVSNHAARRVTGLGYRGRQAIWRLDCGHELRALAVSPQGVGQIRHCGLCAAPPSEGRS